MIKIHITVKSIRTTLILIAIAIITISMEIHVNLFQVAVGLFLAAMIMSFYK